MAAGRKTFTPDHPIVIAFLIFAIIGFMSLAAEVLKPLALAILLSFALAPVAGLLEKFRLPRAAAVVLTILLALGILGAITYKVGQQLTMLANDLPRYEENIKRKITWFRPEQENALDRLTKVGQDVARTLDRPPRTPDVQPVSIVSQPSFTQRLQTAVGPYLESLGVVSFVLILVLFILNSREDLRDRMLRLFGLSRVSLTTRTMDEVGQRISRYLGMFSLVNSAFGVIIGLGLWLIGLKYAVLWGVLFALLRFIPYVGPAAAFALPMIFSFAYFEGWREPLLVVALFGTLEVIANSFLEPVIYGKTTGVSALGLLVAAMFWTWLWGALGLLLSTPMTVCLAVLGKYVPRLSFFATLLGEEDPLTADVRFYQRLLAADQDGATAVVEAALKEQPRAEVFDQVLIPALSRAERDRAHDEIDEGEQGFIWRVVGELLDDLEETPAPDPENQQTGPEAVAAVEGAPRPEEAPAAGSVLQVLGIAANDRGDELVLRMLGQLLPRTRCALTILGTPESPLTLAEHLSESTPDLVMVSHLPPAGATTARYLVRRIRARFATLPILTGHWRAGDDGEEVTARLKAVGATGVLFSLAEASNLLLEKYLAKPEADSDAEVADLIAQAPALSSA
jgi:predicted PurR-regulated permease PerM